MSITKMRIDIEGLQRMLRILKSDPPAVLMIEPDRAVLSVSGDEQVEL